LKYRILHNNPLQFYDTNAELVGTITANGSNLKISSNSGIIELGNTASDIQVGTLGTPITWTFLGGGTIGAGGIGTINMGQSGDTINMNVAGVTYQYPASFLRFNEITATNNKINITTQVPGSVVLSLPQRPVVGQLQLTDAVPSTSNLTGALTVAGGVGIAGNLSVTNATVNGQLGISAPNDSAARLKITATASGAVFNHADNSNIFFQTQGVNRLTIADATGNGTLQGNLTVQGTSTSVSNTTGALTVAGGAGIRGNLYADSITLPPNPTGTSYGAQTYPQFYIGGVVADSDSWKIYAEAPVTNEGRLVFQVEDDITESFVWRAHQFYTAGGTKDLATLNTAIFSVSSNVANFRIRNTTGSTSTSSGAAIIDGGLGVAGNVYSGGVYDTGINIIGFAGRAYNHANAAFTSANTIDGINTTQNNSITAAFTQANTAVTNAGSASIYANGAFLAANSAATLSAATDLTQNNSITAAFTRANNSISANAGGTITGDLVVTGNLTISGQTTYANTINVQLGDNIITLNAELPVSVTPSENAGFEINRGNTLANASLLWIESAGKWQANSGSATGAYFIGSESAGIYANGAFAAANAATATDTTQNNSITASFTQANLAVVNALAASNYANAAFLIANASLLIDTTQNNSITAAFTAANNRVLKTGDTMTGNLVITSGQAPTTNTTGSLVLNGGAGIGGNFYNTGGSALYISANTFGDGGTSSGANALVYINQTNSWGGNQPWSLFVNGYSNLSGLRINGSDTPRALHKTTAGNLGFSLSDGTSVISFGPQNGTFAFTVAPPYNTGVSANNYIQVRPGNTGVNANGVFITVEGVDANSDINIVPKGINGKVNIYSTVASTSNTTGSLVLNGGLGVTGNLFMSSANNFTGSGSGSSYRLGWTDNYFHRSNQFGGVQFTGTYLSLLTNTYVETGYNLVIRGQIYNDSGDLRVFFNAASGVNVANVQAATTNTSGSLIVYGGAGIRGNIYSGGIYITGASSNGITFTDGTTQTTSFTAAGQYANAAFAAANAAIATDITQNNSITAAFTAANNRVLKTGDTMTGNLVITSSQASSNNTTGALVVTGGVGVGGRIYGSSDVYLGDGTGNQNGSSLVWNGSFPTFIQGSSGVGASGYLRSVVGNSGVVGFGIEGSGNYTRIDYSTVATSTTTGALRIIGGVGIGGNVYSGGIYLTGASSNGITFVDGTKQTSAGAGIADVLALSIALG